jgi:20S proteasome subunit beta 6
MAATMVDHAFDGGVQQRFSPYVSNGGSIVAIAGEDFAVVGSDTRLSIGFSILTRDQPKIHRLGSHSVVAQVGFQGDCQYLYKLLNTRTKMYEFDHGQKLTTSSCASMVSKLLYSRRFFPLYVYNLVVGCELEDGQWKGKLYGYDPVGSYQPVAYGAQGSAGPLLQPLLDCEIDRKNEEHPVKLAVTRERAIALVKDVFISAAERDIYSGDQAHIVLIDKDGIHDSFVPLRRD